MEDANKNLPVESNEESRPVALPLRNDTILGVAQGLGEDLGINPNFIRITFCALMFWNVAIAIGAYLGAGVIVAVSRYFFPARRHVAQTETAMAAEPSNSEAELQIAA